MEPKEIFISMGVSFIAIFAVLTWISSLNGAYNTDVGSSFNSSLGRVNSILNNSLITSGQSLGANIHGEEGAGDADTQQAIYKKAFSSFGIIVDLMGLPGELLTEAASSIGIPAAYTSIAVILFVIVFAITIVYLLLLGVRNLL